MVLWPPTTTALASVVLSKAPFSTLAQTVAGAAAGLKQAILCVPEGVDCHEDPLTKANNR
jgi:hypothetical protein